MEKDFQKFINQRVSVYTNKGVFSGILTFVGENKILGWKLQITISKAPIPIDEIYKIQLI